MAKPKFQKLNELHPDPYKRQKAINHIASGLYISAQGTKHFYEALNLLSAWLPEIYGEEFNELKNICS